MSEGKKGHGCLIAFLVVLILIIGSFAGLKIYKNQQYQQAISATYEWPTSGLATMLPQPSSDVGSIKSDTNTHFSIMVREQTSTDFREYTNACIQKGFDNESKQTDLSYIAYNDNGYKLSVDYNSSGKTLAIDLTAPEEMGTLDWPSTGLSAYIPKPTSAVGEIMTDSTTRFSARIGKTSKSDYAAYVKACMDKGFDVDYSRSDDTFRAKNTEGIRITVSYPEYNIMDISIYKETVSNSVNEASSSVIDAETSPAASAESVSQQVQQDIAAAESNLEELTQAADVLGAVASIAQNVAPNSDEVTPEFKETMDDYEAFMNQYCDFMVRYQNATTAELPSMLVDYASLVQQETEWIEKIDAIDESSLSAADDAYYLEVNGRVLARLAQVEGQLGS